MLEIQVENMHIKVELDDFCHNPRTEWDNLGTMLYAHNRYELGDKTFDTSLYASWEEVAKKEIPKGSVVLPLYLYDHSGITMNTTGFHCRWDSGQVGFIYVEREAIRKEFGVKRVTKNIVDKVENILRNEVQAFDDYICGEVYYASIEGDDVDESCGGFLGSDLMTNGVYDFLCEFVGDKDKLKEEILKN